MLMEAQAAHILPKRRAAALIGFESSGKTALFRGMTGQGTGDETNFRGSTITTRTGPMPGEWDLVDLPGIRLKDDSRTTQEAVAAITDADVAILVVRATHAAKELPLLLEAAQLAEKRAILMLTFADKTLAHLPQMVQYYEDVLGIPVRAVDARKLQRSQRTDLLALLEVSEPFRPREEPWPLPSFPMIVPQTTWFEHVVWGRPLSLFMMFLLFAVPVLLAYLLSDMLEPIVDYMVIDPVKATFEGIAPFWNTLFVGDYGLITLGVYSFLWAFPVVLLLGVSVALAEESGMKDRITDSLDAWMRRIGLTGRDLLPVLSGFGCNVVAVFQSRACSACTRKSCVSLIAFGSACSYQIGASLSVFGAAGHPWLFVPYLFALGLVGALHTRVWNRKSAGGHPFPIYESATFLQKPKWRAVNWRVRAVVKQFLLQAMPIFIAICAVAAMMQYAGMLDRLSQFAAPLFGLLHMPAEAASALIFSILRKDGLLVLNQGEGSLLQAMHAGQIFILVYLASTLTACLVTLWTVRKELGWSFAGSMAGKQAVTSLVSTVIMVLVIGW